MFTDTSKPAAPAVTAVIVFSSIQMLLTISMILNRIRALYRAFRVTGPERAPQLHTAVYAFAGSRLPRIDCPRE
jgi:hypothetical protein